jgi:hypothetical protein
MLNELLHAWWPAYRRIGGRCSCARIRRLYDLRDTASRFRLVLRMVVRRFLDLHRSRMLSTVETPDAMNAMNQKGYLHFIGSTVNALP